MILGFAKRSGSVTGVVSCSGEISRNGPIDIGELWIWWSVSSSELDSARCFPLEDPVSDSESSASLAALDGGSESLSCSWMSGLGSPR